jgi:hypothetical protein
LPINGQGVSLWRRRDNDDVISIKLPFNRETHKNV